MPTPRRAAPLGCWPSGRGAPDVDVGFTGVTWPSVPDALDRMARLGHRAGRAVLLVPRDRQARRAGATPGPRLRAAHGCRRGRRRLLRPRPRSRGRHRTTAGVRLFHGSHRTNCDTCSYRAPWPGREDRVGQPRGVGHSHLAAEHRAPRRPTTCTDARRRASSSPACRRASGKTTVATGLLAALARAGHARRRRQGRSRLHRSRLPRARLRAAGPQPRPVAVRTRLRIAPLAAPRRERRRPARRRGRDGPLRRRRRRHAVVDRRRRRGCSTRRSCWSSTPRP